MFYYIDGYNLIFAFSHTKHPLVHQRASVIRYLQERFALLHLKGLLVFDGAHLRGEESGLAYASPLEIAYTPKGQTADEYILEQLEWNKKKQAMTIVSNDRHLTTEARALGAHTQSNEGFIRFLQKKRPKKKAPPRESKDTPQNIARLLKIFEDKLKEE